MFAICPVYASEISPPTLRGRVGPFYSLNISVSYMVTEWLGLAFYFIPGNASWRLLFGLQFIPGIAMLVASRWMPFSPRWLAYVGRYEEAREVLRLMHSESPEGEHFYEVEFVQIKAQIEQDKAEKLGVKQIFTRRSYAKRIALIAGFFFAQQCTGIIPLSNYQVFIYQTLGTNAVLSLVLTGVWGTVSVTSVCTLGFWFDKIGRRNGLFLAYAIMIPAAVIIVGLWAAFETGGNKNINLAKGVNFGIFLTCFEYSAVMNSFGPTVSKNFLRLQDSANKFDSTAQKSCLPISVPLVLR